MSTNRTRTGYRARKRRQRRIILITCMTAAFFLVSAGLLFLIRGEDWLKRPGETVSGAQTDPAGPNGDSTEENPGGFGPGGIPLTTIPAGTEAQDPPTELTIEDIWENDPRTPVQVRGLYLSGSAAVNSAKVDYVIELLDQTEINAVVINLKDDSGYLAVDLDIPLAREIGANDSQYMAFGSVSQLQALISRFKEHGAYVIARIPAFRDNVLGKARTDCSLWWKEGSTRGQGAYVDNAGDHWLDPANETVRQYLLDISQAAVDLGFDEIQYDYVRFPTTYPGQIAYYGGEGYYVKDANGNDTSEYNLESAKLRWDAISSFVEFACRALVPQGIFVSADVYGVILTDQESSGNVGQDYAELSRWLDYICPMVYPSHYDNPIYGVTYPDTQPYDIVKGALADSNRVLASLEGKHCAVVRPWLQVFTASWLTHYIPYGGAEVREQINAVYDEDYSEWLLWNSSGSYTDYRSGILSK